MISTPEGFTDNSPISPMTPTPECIFTNILYVKKKTAIRQVVPYKSKFNTIKTRTKPWTLKPKQTGNSKINDQTKKSP